MTRKDYVVLAQAFERTRPRDNEGYNYLERKQQWELTRTLVSQELRQDNPRFDRDRFYAACEGK